MGISKRQLFCDNKHLWHRSSGKARRLDKLFARLETVEPYDMSVAACPGYPARAGTTSLDRQVGAPSPAGAGGQFASGENKKREVTK